MKLRKIAVALLLASSASFSWANIQQGLSAYYNGDLETSYTEFIESAEENDAAAAFLAGMLLMDENFSKANKDAAEKWLKRAAELGSAEAAYNLAYFYLNNDFADSTQQKYQTYIEKAQALNLPEAFMLPALLANRYDERFGEPDVMFMYQSIMKADQAQSTPFTKFMLGSVWVMQPPEFQDEFNKHGITLNDNDRQKGVSYLEEALSSGFTPALLPLSSVYKGEIEGIEANPIKSEMIEKIIEQKFFQIMSDVAEMNDVQPISIYALQSDEDRQNMIANLMEQSKTDAKAAFRLGDLYLKGGVTGKPDEEKALAMYFQSANLGHYSALKTIHETAYYDGDVQRQMVPIIEKAVRNEDPNGFYFLGLMHINVIQSDYDYDHQTALYYLKKAADLGDVDALQALAYKRTNNLSIQEKDQLRYAKALIKAEPDNVTAYLIASRILMRQDWQKSYDEIYTYVQQVEALEKNHPEQLSLLGDFYGKVGKYQDGVKALNYYDRLIELEASEMYSAEYRFHKALLLKNGAVNLAKDEKAAFDILVTLPMDYVGVALADTLGEMYHYGQGTEVNLPKAIEYYEKGGQKSLIPLGKVLLASEDPEQREDGAYYIISALQDGKSGEESELLLFDHTDLENVQAWLLNVYQDRNIVQAQKAYQLIKAGAKANLPRMRFNYAYILLKGDTEMQAQGQAIMNQLVEENFVPALYHKMHEYSFSDGKERLSFAKKIAEITQDDEDLQELAEIYNRVGQYDAALATIALIKNQERSFLSFRKKDAEEGLEKLQALQVRAEKKDIEAINELAKMASNQGDQKAQIIWLKQAIELNSVDAMRSLAEIMIQQGDPESLKKARALLFNGAKEDDHNALRLLNELYTQNIDPNFTRSELADVMFDLEHQYNIPKAAQYFDELIRYDVAEEALTKYEKGSQQYVQALRNISEMLRSGTGIPKNREKSIQWLKELSEYDDGYAAYLLGEYYADLVYDASNISEKHIKEAADWYQKANEKNYSNAGKRMMEWNDLIQKAKNGDLGAQLALIKYQDRMESPRNIDAQLQALIDQNYDAARIMLAERLLQMPKYEDNYQKALKLLKTAVNNDSEEAAFVLAQVWMRYQYDPDVANVNDEIQSLLLKYPTDKNRELLVSYFIENQNLDSAVAMIEKLPIKEQISFYRHLYFVFSEDSDEIDYAQALKFAEKIAQHDMVDGYYKIGVLYFYGDDTLPQDPDKALMFLQSVFAEMMETELNVQRPFSPNFDSIAREFNPLAKELLLGNKTEQNIGLAWLLDLISHDQEESAELLVQFYKSQGDFVKAYIYARAYGLWSANNFEDQLDEATLKEAQKKADALKDSFKYGEYFSQINELKRQVEEEGFARASLKLGEIYQTGEKAPKNIALAIQYYEQAGQKGESYAYNRLGNLYRKGDDVDVDSEKAIYYFDLGVKQGDSNCAHQAGDVLYFGENGIPKDFVRAAEYFEMANPVDGDHHLLAKYKQAYIYYHGSGEVPQDKQRAHEILEQYESGGNEDIARALKEWQF